jgi:hypothetical protein
MRARTRRLKSACLVIVISRGELVAPVGVNLLDAVIFCLGLAPVFGLTLGVVGAALGARRTLPRHRAQGCPQPMM